jgi:hypothetical protein
MLDVFHEIASYILLLCLDLRHDEKFIHDIFDFSEEVALGVDI